MLIFQETAKKYIIYVRKSTDESSKQEKSIDDQLTYCRSLAERDQLNVVDTVMEKRSAKISWNRPLFSDILNKIQDGLIDGIIAYHPDRLARNMLEAGVLIDMVDKGLIVDLRFCTQQFSKDSSWKMLLWMAFVLSKQYSDKISDDVRRARDLRHNEGMTNGVYKPWYDQDKDKRYIKGKFWDEIKHAWEMKLEWRKNNDIVRYLHASGFYRELTSGTRGNKRQFMTEQKLSAMFKDPVYYGELVLGWKVVSLKEKYNFSPMVTQDEFFIVMRDKNRGDYNTTDRKPLKGKLFDFWNPEIEYKPQIISNGKGNKYLMYVVDPKTKKSIEKETWRNFNGIRAFKLVNALDKCLAEMYDNLLNNKHKFNQYKKSVEGKLVELQDDRKNQLMILKRAKTRQQNELNTMVDNFAVAGGTYDILEKRRYEKKKAEYLQDIEKLERDTEEFEERGINSLDYEDFLNTMKTLLESYKQYSGDHKLRIAENLVLNIFIKGWEVHQIELSEPFNTLLSENNPIWLPG